MSLVRYLRAQISRDLNEKMVFLAGPRQVGKTTLALSFLESPSEEHAAYFNWDFPQSRAKIKSLDFPRSEKIIVLDEIHKFKRWRNLVKGAYDQFKRRHKFLVTGSARLDYYNKGGESLQGRYHLLRLHPISLPEAKSFFPKVTLEDLFRFGGFPEPLFRKDDVSRRRWDLERRNRIVAEDVASLERIQEISLIEMLFDALPERVGAPLSYKNLADNLEVAPRTVKRWVDVFERLYVCFRLAPYGAPRIRAVKKEQKLYFYDWATIEDPGSRFENMVACHLLKYCHFLEDTQGHRMELRYLRDTDGREVDFIVLKDRKPVFAVECKFARQAASSHLFYFKLRAKIPKTFQVFMDSIESESGDEESSVNQLSFPSLCKRLALV